MTDAVIIYAINTPIGAFKKCTKMILQCLCFGSTSHQFDE